MTIAHEFMNVLNMLAVPGEVVAELNERPRWRAPIIAAIAAAAIVSPAMLPAVEQPMRNIYTRSFGDAGGAAAAGLRFYVLSAFALDVAGALTRWACIAVSLLILLRASGWKEPQAAGKLFAIAAYGEIVFILMSVLTVLVIYAKGLDAIASADDLVIFKGLNVFLPDRAQWPATSALLAGFNPFGLWYVILLTVGVRSLSGLSRASAFALAAIAWIIWSALTAAPALLTSSLFGILLL